MLGCYRRGDAEDPDTYVTAVTATLARYSTDIVREVSNPFTGIPSRQNFLPTIAEVKKACEELVTKERGERERNADLKAQLHRRQTDRELDAEKGDRSAHIAKLRSAGRLKFGKDAKEIASWFDHMTLEKAENILANYEQQSTLGWISPEDAALILAKSEREAKQHQDEELL